MQDGAFAAAAATASALRSIRARRDLGGGSVSVPLATRPALGWHTATPARVRIAEPAVSRDHFLDAHFEASHAAVPGDVMADIAHRAPGAFIISLACGSIDQHWCRRRCDDERDSHASASRHHTTSFDSHRTSPIGAPCYSSRRGSGADRDGFVKGGTLKAFEASPRRQRAHIILQAVSVTGPLSTRPALGWHTATPARVRIAEPAVSRDHFLAAHLERAHAAVPGHLAADIGDCAPGSLIGSARAKIEERRCRDGGRNEDESHGGLHADADPAKSNLAAGDTIRQRPFPPFPLSSARRRSRGGARRAETFPTSSRRRSRCVGTIGPNRTTGTLCDCGRAFFAYPQATSDRSRASAPARPRL